MLFNTGNPLSTIYRSCLSPSAISYATVGQLTSSEAVAVTNTIGVLALIPLEARISFVASRPSMTGWYNHSVGKRKTINSAKNRKIIFQKLAILQTLHDTIYSSLPQNLNHAALELETVGVLVCPAIVLTQRE